MIWILFNSVVGTAGVALILGTLGAVSLVCSWFARTRKSGASSSPEARSIAILIPAHNEQTKIAETLRSLERERASLPAAVRFEIVIALDRCTDQTEQAAQSAGFPVHLTKVEFGNKWRALEHLVRGVDSEWVFLVDAGTTWEPGLLARVYREIGIQPDALAIAPSYRIEGGSKLARVFWLYESALKTLENGLGGPISLHGATIAYRRDVLARVFEELGPSIDYKNDDIILPLACRIYFPKLRTIYLRDVHALDHADREKSDHLTQLRRRRRMVLGNLQWMRWMSGERDVPLAVFAVALRRILRPFWVYGFIFLAIGFSPWALLPVLLFPTAAIASALAPLAWFRRWDEKFSVWR